MSEFVGLNVVTDSSKLYAMNFYADYTAPVDIADNIQTGWQGLIPKGNVDFVTLNPLGFNRAFLFTSGPNIYGSNDLLSKAGAILSPRDQIILDQAAKSGVPLYLSQAANKANFVLVSALPAYATPGVPIRVTIIPDIYIETDSLDFSYLDNSAYYPVVS
jgi:hypothetical protein